MNDIRLHRIAELTPELMAELAAGGYRAVRDPDVVIYVADSAPVRLGQADPDAGPDGGPDGGPDADPQGAKR